MLVFSIEKLYKEIGGKHVYDMVKEESGINGDVHGVIDMMPVVGVTIDGSSMYIVEAEDGTMHRVHREWCVEGEPRALGAWATYDEDEDDERVVNMILERDDEEDDDDDEVSEKLEKARGISSKIARINEISNIIREDIDGNGDMTMEEFFALMLEGIRLSEETGKEIDEL